MKLIYFPYDFIFVFIRRSIIIIVAFASDVIRNWQQKDGRTFSALISKLHESLMRLFKKTIFLDARRTFLCPPEMKFLQVKKKDKG